MCLYICRLSNAIKLSLFPIKMWIFVLISATILYTSSNALDGENVCQEKETYKVNVTRYVLRNVTIRSYIWCLQFPPRCTNFSVKQLNDTDIKEEDGVRYKSVCCSGYELDKDGNKCIASSSCSINCLHGTCDEESKCYCNPGYRGDDCSKECIHNRWGRYCRYHCNCIRGTCNPETGLCSCPAGWSGIGCNETCSKGTFGYNCTSVCNCQSNDCNPIDGQCIYIPNNQNTKHKITTNVDNGLRRFAEDATRNDSTRAAVLQKYHTFNVKVMNSSDAKITTTEPILKQGINTTYNKILSSTEIANTENSTSFYWKAHDNFVLTLERVSASTISKIFMENVTESAPKLLRMKVLKSYNEDDSRTSLNNAQTRVEAYLDDEKTNKNVSTPTRNLFFTIGAVAGLSLLLIGVLSIILSVRRYKKIAPIDNEDNKLETIAKNTKATANVSVVTRSIFHTPLPDLPIINNPIFTTPIENSTTSETQVIYKINTNQNNPGTVELFYDHPQFIGTVLLPEPPEKDCLENRNGFCINTNEPVYDEIPYWKTVNTEYNQIYQNDTSGIYINS